MIEIKKKDQQEVIKAEEKVLSDGSVFPMLTFPVIAKTGIVEHCFTTRAGGVSRGVFESLNLSFTRGDDADAVRENFRRLAEAMGVNYNDFVFSDQTHTTNVRRITRADAGNGLTREKTFFDVDGLITDEPGIVLATFFADCVPLYFVDPVHRAIGLSHSGWRGTVGRMGRVTIEAMKRAFGTRPQDLVCAIGPSICQDCYEVSEDVADVFAAEFPEHINDILIAKGDGKYQLDLWYTNAIILQEAGVDPSRIAVTNICTCCNPKLLFSHRASKGKRGNLGAFLSIKEEV